jgi:rhodanese-related sulfurtransferase
VQVASLIDLCIESNLKAGAMELQNTLVIAQRIQDIKKFKEPLVLCCASGSRSGMAHSYLSQQGVYCVNGGSWWDVQDFQSQTA